MESQCQVALFSWLGSPSTQAFELQTVSLTQYQEGHAPASSQRLRLVFDICQQQVISDWIASLSAPVAIASLNRTSGLCGLEIALNSPLSEAQWASLAAIDLVDIFEPKNTLTRLDVPGLLVMDMDSTAIQIECIDELAAMAGVGEAVAEVTERAMQGELDFEQSLRERVAKLTGASSDIIETLCRDLPLMPGLIEMIAELKSHGWKLVLASGGFTPFVGHLKQLLNLDAAYANQLVIVDDKLTGEVTGQVVDAQYKADVVGRCGEQWQIAAGQRVAIGDGANDIPMVRAADFGIAFHAKPKLAGVADAQINKLDLRVLPYYLQLNQ